MRSEKRFIYFILIIISLLAQKSRANPILNSVWVVVYVHEPDYARQWIADPADQKYYASLFWRLAELDAELKSEDYWRKTYYAARYAIKTEFVLDYAVKLDTLCIESGIYNSSYHKRFKSLQLYYECLKNKVERDNERAIELADSMLLEIEDERLEVYVRFVRLDMALVSADAESFRHLISSDKIIDIKNYKLGFRESTYFYNYLLYYTEFIDDTSVKNRLNEEVRVFCNNVVRVYGFFPDEILSDMSYFFLHNSEAEMFRVFNEKLLLSPDLLGLVSRKNNQELVLNGLMEIWKTKGEYAISKIYSDELLCIPVDSESGNHYLYQSGLINYTLGYDSVARSRFEDLIKSGCSSESQALNALNCMALAESRLGMYDESRKHFLEAIERRKAQKPVDYYFLAKDYQNYSELLLKTGDFDQAMKFARISLDMKMQYQGLNFLSVSLSQLTLGDVFLASRDYMSAIELYNDAGRIIGNPNAIADLSNSTREILKLRFLQKKSLAVLKLSATDQGKSKQYLHESISHSLRASALADSIFNNLQLDEEKVHFAGIRRNYQLQGIEACYMLSGNGDEETIETALFFSEESHAGLLKENRVLSNFDLASEEKQVRANITGLQQKIAQSTNDSLIRQYRNKLRLLQQKHSEIRHSMAASPGKSAFRKKTLKEVREFLGRRTLVEYFVSDTVIYLIAVNQSASLIFRIPQVDSVAACIDVLKKHCRKFSPEYFSEEGLKEYSQAARNLYRLILEPAEDIIGEDPVLIIPDGILAVVPFEALLYRDCSKNENSFATLPYLIRKNKVMLGYSIYLQMEGKPASHQYTNSVLIYSPDYDSVPFLPPGSGVELTPLPGALSEAGTLGEGFNGTSRVSNWATEENFKQEAGGAQIIHLSMHGMLDSRNPVNSALIFQGGSSVDDGLLYFWEIGSMDINARLVILGACNSGDGGFAPGVGVLSIAYAFADAGCPAVLASVWATPDDNPAGIIQDFYKRMSEGASCFESIYGAKIQNLNSGDPVACHPSFWAGYAYYGEDVKVDLKKSTSIGYYISGICVFISLCALALRMLNRRKAA